jgi:hypothetical protein
VLCPDVIGIDVLFMLLEFVEGVVVVGVVVAG